MPTTRLRRIYKAGLRRPRYWTKTRNNDCSQCSKWWTKWWRRQAIYWLLHNGHLFQINNWSWRNFQYLALNARINKWCSSGREQRISSSLEMANGFHHYKCLLYTGVNQKDLVPFRFNLVMEWKVIYSRLLKPRSSNKRWSSLRTRLRSPRSRLLCTIHSYSKYSLSCKTSKCSRLATWISQVKDRRK